MNFGASSLAYAIAFDERSIWLLLVQSIAKLQSIAKVLYYEVLKTQAEVQT